MSDVTSQLPRVLIEASKAELHATGAVPRPQVHMLAEDMEHSYIGFVICRMFYRGQDAATAIGDLGALPSVMKMTRLMILWENLDLLTALDQGTDPAPMALMLLDAQFNRHTLYRHPFEAVPTGQVVNGVPTVRLRWEAPQRSHDGPLPDPIIRLLRTWRELREDDMQETAIALQRSGYELNWATPTG
ncbi:hypothetical protein [Actinomadura rubrisoli]|uniref:Uncharacterized protein n=1 Tax=Actinomadura rubrisoli TaxID=2530368 RepID=A0A4R5BG94_9ACTN|nr:hypothetical protein [Actinomadura rubrisoli]TDD85401.1 hypothetical protein E1298_18715 [Actinomadura rubrisoli]